MADEVDLIVLDVMGLYCTHFKVSLIVLDVMGLYCTIFKVRCRANKKPTWLMK